VPSLHQGKWHAGLYLNSILVLAPGGIRVQSALVGSMPGPSGCFGYQVLFHDAAIDEKNIARPPSTSIYSCLCLLAGLWQFSLVLSLAI